MKASTYRLVECFVAFREIDLVVPAALYACKNVGLGNVFYPGLCVVVWVIFEDDSLHLALRPADPAFFQVM